MTKIRQFFKSEKGDGHRVRPLAALVSVTIIAALTLVGGQSAATFNAVAAALNWAASPICIRGARRASVTDVAGKRQLPIAETCTVVSHDNVQCHVIRVVVRCPGRGEFQSRRRPTRVPPLCSGNLSEWSASGRIQTARIRRKRFVGRGTEQAMIQRRQS